MGLNFVQFFEDVQKIVEMLDVEIIFWLVFEALVENTLVFPNFSFYTKAHVFTSYI